MQPKEKSKCNTKPAWTEYIPSEILTIKIQQKALVEAYMKGNI